MLETVPTKRRPFYTPTDPTLLECENAATTLFGVGNCDVASMSASTRRKLVARARGVYEAAADETGQDY